MYFILPQTYMADNDVQRKNVPIFNLKNTFTFGIVSSTQAGLEESNPTF